MRISRDGMFMEIARVVAQRGTCDRGYVGAVLVEDNKNIIAIGYNGAPSGKPHCNEIGHNLVNGHCTNAIHAEINCLDKVISSDYLVHGYLGWAVTCAPLTLYVTHYPCMACTQRIIVEVSKGLPIKRIVFLYDYGQEPLVRQKLLEGVGIKIERYMGESVEGNTTT